MKTTNKILIIALVAGLTLSTILMLKISSFIQLDVVELSGIITKKTQSISSFDHVVAKKSINVLYKVSDENKLVIEADTVLFKHIVINAKKDKLILNLNAPLPESQHALVTIYSKVPASIKVEQGATFKTTDTLRSDTLHLDLQRGSKASLNANLNHLNCDQWESSDVEISGNSKSMRVNATQGSKFNGYEFETIDAELSSTAGAQLYVFVSGSINVKASEGGMVEYKGKPTVGDMDIRSGGRATNAD